MKVVSKQSQQQQPGKYKAIAEAAQNPHKQGINNDVLESDDDDVAPGPGAYFDSMKHTNFKNETKPHRLQFFGSTVERFTDQKGKKGNEEIGPGTYQVAG